MGRLRIIFVALLVMLNSSVFAYETSNQVIKFPLSSENKSVELTFSGAVFNAENAPLVSKLSDNEINVFIYKIIQTNKNKDIEAILNLWGEDEKNGIKDLVSNPKLLERNSSFFRNILSSRLMGYIEYGDFIICYVKHDVKGMSSPYLKTYPLILNDKKLFQTNKLSSDFLFSKLDTALGEFIWPN